MTRRPAWERQVLKTVAALVRLEGEQVSLDGGVTRENHAPAVSAALKPIVEDRVIPLLKALAIRDRVEALRLVRAFTHREPVIETVRDIIPERQPIPPAAAAKSWLKTLFATPPHDQVAQQHLEGQTRRLMNGAAYWASDAGKRRRLAIQLGTMKADDPDPPYKLHPDDLDTTHTIELTTDQRRTDSLGKRMLGWLRIAMFKEAANG